MVEEAPIGPAREGVLRHFLEEEATAGPKHPGDFTDRSSPVWYVMNDPEVEDRVVARVLGGNRGRIPLPEAHVLAESGKPPRFSKIGAS